MNYRILKISIITGPCLVGVCGSIFLLYRHALERELEDGRPDEALSVICTRQSKAMPLPEKLRLKLVAASPIPPDATYSNGFVILGYYAIIMATQHDRTRDFVYIYRITNQQEAVFVRQFYVDRG